MLPFENFYELRFTNYSILNIPVRNCPISTSKLDERRQNCEWYGKSVQVLRAQEIEH